MKAASYSPPLEKSEKKSEFNNSFKPKPMKIEFG